MGNFEKLVVLAVLFVAAIVLAVSLNRDKDEAQASGPLAAAGAPHAWERESGEPARETGFAPGDALPDDTADTLPPSLLLSAGELEPEPATPGPEPSASSAGSEPLTLQAGDRPARILQDVTGLRPSFLDDFMIYTAAENETWSGLAQRFYRDGRYTRNLRDANDTLGFEELRAGTEILVPVYDLQQEAGLRPPLGASFSGSPAGAPPAGPDSRPAPGASQGTTLEYVVQSGDTLSDLSVAIFGTATRWMEILEANKDRLGKPEDLREGMKLRVPPGGKLPAPAATAKKSEREPATKTAQAGPTTKPKKKVL